MHPNMEIEVIEISTTTMQVKEKTWKRLNALRGPGTSFDDVIQDLLDEAEGGAD